MILFRQGTVKSLYEKVIFYLDSKLNVLNLPELPVAENIKLLFSVLGVKQCRFGKFPLKVKVLFY